MATNKSQKIPTFECDICYIKTSHKHDYEKHLLTRKHKINATGNKCATEFGIKSQERFDCSCGKNFKNRSGLWRHKKKCSVNESIYESSEIKLFTSIFQEQLKENKELKELLVEQNKQIVEQNKLLMEKCVNPGNSIVNSNNNNTTNNTKFNMNIFLNENCKDAMNIMDFVNSLQLKLSDLELMGELGYAEGISKIFVNGLKQLDVCKRPVHCSDLKRETLYVKDKDVWEKETNEKDRLKLAIRHISKNNLMQLQEWKDMNPEHRNLDSKVHDKYVKIRSEALGGVTTEDDEKYYNKIIKRVATATIIEKEC